jgi:hypothetical protein
MIDRLRFLLDRPLDPLAARAVVVFATAILLSFAALFVLGSGESSGPPAAGEQASSPPPPRSGRSHDAPVLEAQSPAAPRPPRRRQDPQDEKGSAAATRAAKVLRSHRALQHVPYRRGAFTVHLVGVARGRAVLAIDAPTISAARRGWRRFLRRYGDSGRSYVPRFLGSGSGAAHG